MIWPRVYHRASGAGTRGRHGSWAAGWRSELASSSPDISKRSFRSVYAAWATTPELVAQQPADEQQAQQQPILAARQRQQQRQCQEQEQHTQEEQQQQQKQQRPGPKRCCRP